MESIGSNIKYYRTKKGLSIETLARLLSVSPDLVRYWEDDQREPSNQTLKNIAALFKIDINDLMSTKPREKKIPVYSYESKGRLVGVCSRCGKSIYSEEKYGLGKEENNKGVTRFIYDPKDNTGNDYFCDNCCKELLSLYKIEKKEQIIKDKKRNSKIFIFSILMGILALAIVVAASIVIYFLLKEKLYAYVICGASLPFGYYVFSTLYSIFIGQNWINEAVVSYAKYSFVKLPKKILEKDANDVLKTGVIKAAFLAISYVLAGTTLTLLIILLGICSMFTWPSFKRKNKELLSKREEEK